MNLAVLYAALAIAVPPPTAIGGGTDQQVNEALLADIEAVEAVRHVVYHTALPFRDYLAINGRSSWPEAEKAIYDDYRSRLAALNEEHRRRKHRQHAFAKKAHLPIYRPARHY